jgi:hypothetical protein
LTIHHGTLSLTVGKGEGGKTEYRPLRFTIPTGGLVGAMRLEPWLSSGGLSAIVQVAVNDEFQYSCVTMAAPSRSEGYDSGAAVFLRSKENYKVLALTW